MRVRFYYIPLKNLKLVKKIKGKRERGGNWIKAIKT